MGHTKRLISKDVTDEDKRVTDLTDGSEFREAHNDTEVACATIFGIEVGQVISPGSGIFGGVRSDGGITLIRFTSESAGTDPDDSIGFEFRDGNVIKRFSYANSKFRIWTWNGSEWEAEYDLESSEEPTLLSKDDVRRAIGYVEDMILGVEATPISDEYRFNYLNANALSDGYIEAAAMTDCDFTVDSNSEGQMMATNQDKDDPKFVLQSLPDDRRQYGLYQSAFREVQYSAGLTWLDGFSEVTVTAGGSGEFNDNIRFSSSTLDGIHNGFIGLPKGLWVLRTRMNVRSRVNRYGAMLVTITPTSSDYVKVLTPNSVESMPLRINRPSKAQEFHLLVLQDYSEFRIGLGVTKNCTAAISAGVVIEIEGVN